MNYVPVCVVIIFMIANEGAFDPDWREYAACQFLPEEQKLNFVAENWATDEDSTNEAKQICLEVCPVQTECAYSGINEIPKKHRKYSIFGGMDPEELEILIQRYKKKQSETLGQIALYDFVSVHTRALHIKHSVSKESLNDISA